MKYRNIKTLFVIAILFTLVLSGCAQLNPTSKSDEEKLVGTWSTTTTGTINDQPYNETLIYTFFSDGSAMLNYSAGEMPATWQIKNEKLILNFEEATQPATYNYQFSENDDQLTLTDIKNDEKLVLKKQSK
ncbi:MAG: DUF5640 domain-containing protein [Candidatus Thermoplasmatota archaeon]